MIWLNVIVILVTLTASKGEYFSLNSNDWFLSSDDGQYQINDASVPGGIYTELRRANIIQDDFFYAKNDVAYRFYSKMDWTWSRKFQFTGETIAQGRKILLIADGIDTVSNIFLNGVFVGSTTNMFVRYQFDITNVINPGLNHLQVRIVSPIYYSNSSFAMYKQKYGYSVPPQCNPDEYNGECHANFIRKMAASYAWDWGPAFPSLGLWQPIGIEYIDKPVLKDISASINSVGNNWTIDIDLRILKPDGISSTNARVFLDGKEIFNPRIDLDGLDTEINYKLQRVLIPKKDIELWWPNGIGNYTGLDGYKPFSQRLYNLTVKLVDMANPVLNLGSISKRIGFREIELLEEAIPGQLEGLSFQFRVNGQLMFLKGTNIIPFSVFPEVVDVAYIHDLLTAVVKGGMNIVRIWGGGVYQSDIFYDLADEMGILIWHDFMFACNAYPTNPTFLESVALEIGQQIDRLKSHPSIALWAGNNENEQALTDPWWPEVNLNPELYKRDYLKLYMDVILPIVLQKDPGRIFLPSSPSNGQRTIDKGGWDGNPKDFHYGDFHFYDFETDPWDYTLFPRARCITEYGLQSHPSLETYLPVIPTDQLTWPLSGVLVHRQHKSVAASWMVKYIDVHLNLPQPGGRDALKKYIYLTQVLQTEGIKLQSETYLRDRYIDPDTGLAMTWGALYWQLNDVWQAPSWASIEFGGKWKMLHYSVVNFFKPIHVQAYREGDNVKVIANNDMVNRANILISVEVYKYSSFEGVKLFEGSPRVDQFEAPQVFNNSVESILSQGECESQNHCLIRIRYRLSTASSSSPSSWRQTSTAFPATLDGENYLLLSSPKSAVGLTAGNLRIGSVTKVKDNSTGGVNRFKIEVQSDSIALWVWLDFKLGSGIKGTFSENGFFHFDPNKTVFFDDATGNPDEARLANNLEVTSLFENIK